MMCLRGFRRGWVSVVGAIVALALAPAEQAWGSSWTIQSATGVPGVPSGFLKAISCTRHGACVAVGGYAARLGCTAEGPCVGLGDFETLLGVTGALIERRSGGRWSIEKAPRPAGADSILLHAVSCAGALACTAVGDYTVASPDVVDREFVHSGVSFPLALRREGGQWSIEPIPLPAGARSGSLTGVSCATVSACMAVGTYYGDGRSRSFAVQWTGQLWRLQTLAALRGLSPDRVSRVSCSSSDACTAVGSVVERWNGAAWQIQTLVGGFSDVSCPSRRACVAVGGTLVGRWNGARWRLSRPAALPRAFTAGSSWGLTGVTCTAGSACVGVGSVDAPPVQRSPVMRSTLMARWNGRTWKVQAGGAGQLNGVACSSSRACTAVGSVPEPNFISQTLAERLRGATWRREETPNASGPIDGQLNSVSCSSSDRCTAVGDLVALDVNDESVLAERWDGRRWTLQRVPPPAGADYVALDDVSCSSDVACVAVGTYGTTGSGFDALAESWDGSRWTLRRLPGDQLLSVSCPPSNHCIAVGVGEWASYDGNAWAVHATTGGTADEPVVLEDVSCASDDACWAIGADNSRNVGVFESWNGTAWSSTDLPSGVTLLDVYCDPASTCEAFGSDANGTNEKAGWDGTSWSIQQPPYHVYPQGLGALSCLSASQCMSVGTGFGPLGHYLTAASVWNGMTWSDQTPAPLGDGSWQLRSLSCTGVGVCVAVGATGSTTGLLSPLIEREQ